MNEWLPGGNYSSPGTPKQTERSLRSQWDESEKGTKPLVNARTVSENRNKSLQQHSMEDVSTISLTNCNKKEGGNGISDPRFKRVITPGKQNTVCVGTEAKNSKALLVTEGKESFTSKFSVWNATEFKPNKSWIDCVKNFEQSNLRSKDNWEPGCENIVTEEDSNFDQSQDHLKAVDKLSFSHDVLVKPLSKESISECTINTRNMSLVSEEFGDEFSNAVTRVPSATRVKKVQNWIHDQTPKLEKKHSVITVIGQIQEPDTLSSALQEIDKRRKLVKELDKYAVCKKIIESDKEKEISDLMIKINSMNNGKEAISSGLNKTLNTYSLSAKLCEDKLSQNSDEFANGKFQMLVNGLPHQRMFYILIILSGLLCWFACALLRNGTCSTFDWFNSKPKPITWYERICKWLWEFFRPFGNYKRTKPWRSY